MPKEEVLGTVSMDLGSRTLRKESDDIGSRLIQIFPAEEELRSSLPGIKVGYEYAFISEIGIDCQLEQYRQLPNSVEDFGY